jgi:UDP-3-O-[3-hydroxymyristoyl] glucosamine N-acyltransferase
MLLSDIALKLGLERIGPDKDIAGVNTLESSSEKELSFLVNPKYAPMLATTRAGAVLCPREYASHVECALVSDSVYFDLARIGAMFDRPQGRFAGVSELASIDPSATLGEGVTVYPHVFVGPETTIGEGCTLFPGVYVGERSRLGRGCTLMPNVVLMSDVTMGDNVRVHAGTVLGADGFGYAQGLAGHTKIPQIGRVEIGDDVEIGANTCVDRAALDVTRISRGTKVDNLVQVAHNVTLGEHCLVAAQVGISGSVRVGSGVVMGGGAGFKDNIEVGDGAMIGGRAGVTNSLPAVAKVTYNPHMDIKTYLRVGASLPRLPDAIKRLRKLEKEVERLAALLEEKRNG